MTFIPRLDALPPAQRALWPELAAVPHRAIAACCATAYLAAYGIIGIRLWSY